MGRVKSKAITMVAVALMLAILSCSTALAATDPYSGTTTGTLGTSLTGGRALSSGGVMRGTTLMLSGSGFKPNSKFNVLWDGRVVVDPLADAKGNISYSYRTPQNASAGIHTVSVQGVTPSGATLALSADVKVVTTRSSTRSSSFPFTGGGMLQYLLLAGVALIAVGFGVKIARRAR